MTRREYVYAGVLVALIALAVVVESAAPTPVDWTDSFEAGDARPYASEAVVSVLPELFPEAAVEPVSRPPYLHLRDTTWTGTRYLFVTSRFAPDPTEAQALLDYVARGNVLFVAASTMDGPLADSLGVALERANPFADVPLGAEAVGGSDSARVQFAAPSLRAPGGYAVRADAAAAVFTRVDTARTTLLASRADSTGAFDPDRPVLVRRPWGAGQVVLAATPRLFTNAHLLRDGSRGAVTAALAYVPPGASRVFWDAHHKPLAIEAESPLRYVQSEPALRMAWWLVLGGSVLFIVMQGRRRQRVIPVVEPPENTTVAFVETVGGLYHRTGDHAGLARKKIRYFLASLRGSIDVETATLDADWIDRVHRRTGVPRDVVDALVQTIRSVRSQEELRARDLRRLDRQMQRFQDHRRR